MQSWCTHQMPWSFCGCIVDWLYTITVRTRFRSCCRIFSAFMTSGYNSLNLLHHSIRSWKLLSSCASCMERHRGLFWCRPFFSAFKLFSCQNVLSSQCWVCCSHSNRQAMAFAGWLNSCTKFSLANTNCIVFAETYLESITVLAKESDSGIETTFTETKTISSWNIARASVSSACLFTF